MVNELPKITREIDTLMQISSNGKILNFIHPPSGPGDFADTGVDILTRNQRMPIGDETASLVHAAYCIPEVYEEPEFRNLRKIMDNYGIWTFNRIVWTENGVYVNQDLSTDAWKLSFDLKTMGDRVRAGKTINGVRFSLDETLRFAPKISYKFGEQKAEEMANNGYVIASCGVEGAGKLAEVAKKFRLNPYVDGIETNDFQKGTAALSILNGERLVIGGHSFAGFGASCAYGLRDSQH